MPAAAPLAGVRVIDFTRVLAGPYATMLLADLGADVIKVEGPNGDDTRAWRPPLDEHGMSTYFASVNRNKRTVMLDLKGPDREEALRLAAGADVLVENMKPGTMQRLGLGHEVLSAANPGLIYCSVSGFGEEAGRDLPGYDLLVQALGGLMSITGEAGGHPQKVGVALVDVITGLHATTGIQAALLERTRSGRGQRITVNLLSSLLSALVNQASSAVLAGATPRAMGNAHPSIAPYETYMARDRSLVIAVGNDRQFRELARVLGHPGWAEDDRYRTNEHRVAHRDQLRADIEHALNGRDASEWAAMLMGAGIPAGAINTIPEALALASDLGLEPVMTIESDGMAHRTVRNPIGLSRTPPAYLLPPPGVPAEGDQVEWRPASDTERIPTSATRKATT